MKIKLNGAIRTLNQPTTIQQLLEDLCLCSDHVVVELNRNILASDLFSKQTLQEDDELEIVQFVGGG